MIPELVFRNPVLISGTNGANGAKYKFANVCTTPKALDAIVEIRGRSASDVVLRTIDSTGIGWDKAFQPCLGIPNVGRNREWWMEFEIEFREAGRNNSEKIDRFFITGLDIDGDGGNLNEWAEMFRPKSVQLSPVTGLVTTLLGTIVDLVNPDNDGNNYRINGPRTNYANIDTSATAVMATYMYEKKSKIGFRLGGRTNNNGGSSGEVGVRMNSFWFKQFSLTPPSIISLPVELTDFHAQLNGNRVDLSWTTQSEKNVSHFLVQKSEDGKTYTDAGLVFAYGNTNEQQKYAFPDNNINTSRPAVIYYRLKSVDFDAKTQLSDVRIIRTGGKYDQALSLNVFPNPAQNELRVTVPANWQGKKIRYEVLTASGQLVSQTERNAANQTETMDLSRLQTGFYIIRASAGGEQSQQKFLRK